MRALRGSSYRANNSSVNCACMPLINASYFASVFDCMRSSWRPASAASCVATLRVTSRITGTRVAKLMLIKSLKLARWFRSTCL